jgi:hypothetical protein
MGGSKVLDNLQNVILVCGFWNNAMESDPGSANLARDLGHKLSKFLSPGEPCFDKVWRKWYFLDKIGNKVETSPPSYLI